MSAALPKINRIERYSYNIEWNKFGAIFYGGLARQVELTKERKAAPPDPAWPEFECAAHRRRPNHTGPRAHTPWA